MDTGFPVVSKKLLSKNKLTLITEAPPGAQRGVNGTLSITNSNTSSAKISIYCSEILDNTKLEVYPQDYCYSQIDVAGKDTIEITGICFSSPESILAISNIGNIAVRFQGFAITNDWETENIIADGGLRHVGPVNLAMVLRSFGGLTQVYEGTSSGIEPPVTPPYQGQWRSLSGTGTIKIPKGIAQVIVRANGAAGTKTINDPGTPVYTPWYYYTNINGRDAGSPYILDIRGGEDFQGAEINSDGSWDVVYGSMDSEAYRATDLGTARAELTVLGMPDKYQRSSSGGQYFTYPYNASRAVGSAILNEFLNTANNYTQNLVAADSWMESLGGKGNYAWGDALVAKANAGVIGAGTYVGGPVCIVTGKAETVTGRYQSGPNFGDTFTFTIPAGRYYAIGRKASISIVYGGTNVSYPNPIFIPGKAGASATININGQQFNYPGSPAEVTSTPATVYDTKELNGVSEITCNYSVPAGCYMNIFF